MCWLIHKFLMVLWIWVVTAVMLPFFLILHIETSLIFFLSVNKGLAVSLLVGLKFWFMMVQPFVFLRQTVLVK